ncbi:MAG TPA: xanthine dehydrogenase family protein molybdopterin-binding subunit [Gemmataceae bacterium]|nr:xanthine dehydrogenase family protein molybdopterin-binding subunit [Gemmataceae bacterium]
MTQQAPAARPAPPPTHAIEVPVGIPGVDLTTAQRLVGLDEPPPLPPNSQLKTVGKPTTRIDGRLKVTGAARYTADINLPGLLYGVLITSPHPHARIRSIDTSEAERYPGVKAMHVLETLLGVAQEQGEEKNRYPLVRFAGQPVAGLAATTRNAAEEAARLVKVDYEVLPFVVDTDEAMKPDAPLVFTGKAVQAGTAGGGGGPRGVPQKGNVRGPATGGTRGGVDIEKALADSEVVVETEYRTQVQTHSALETHGVVADWKPDMLTVYASTQGTGSVRDELAAVFDLAKSKVRVITEFMGGGFGAKFGAGNFGVVATHLSKKAGAPVKLMLSRMDEHLSVGNRPNSVQKIRIGARKDGTLTAIHLHSYGTAGVGTGAGTAGPAQNLYACPAIHTEEYDVFTHTGPAAAFRAPGHPQGCFAFEQAIDELAEKLGMDPAALREKIDVGGDRSDAHREERRIGAERIGWSGRRPAGADRGPIKRGMGMAQSIWYRFTSAKDSNCEVRITKDGSVELMSGVQDIGGGIRTALAQIVAEELGLRPTDITIKIGDTHFPSGPASGGSVTTGSITPPAREAAYKAKLELLREIAPKLGEPAESLVIEDGKVFSRENRDKSISFRGACAKLEGEDVSGRARRREEYTDGAGKRIAGATGGVQFAQVAVDTETGQIVVEHVVAVHDCGRPINPLALESQINGGVLQGVSYALFEDRILDKRTGRMVNPNLEQYKIVGAREVPKIEAMVIEQYLGRSSTDAAGIGEPAIVATAAAIANAVYNAIGVRIRELPMTPARVLAALALADQHRSART